MEEVEYLGQKFWKLSNQDPIVASIGKLSSDTAFLLIPKNESDSKLQFPLEDDYGSLAFFIKSGMVTHRIEFLQAEPRGEESVDRGILASNLEMFREDDWYGECFQVMMAHGWLAKNGHLSRDIKMHVLRAKGRSFFMEMFRRHRENWEIAIAECALVDLVKPLNRLWYAVSMKALYYIHYDDFRLGFLWAEYGARMALERHAERGRRQVEHASAGGKERRQRLRSRMAETLAHMQSSISNDTGVIEAARRAYKAGLGTSIEANRKLWGRHRSK